VLGERQSSQLHECLQCQTCLKTQVVIKLTGRLLIDHLFSQFDECSVSVLRAGLMSWLSRCINNTIQCNKIESEKCQWHRSHFTVSHGTEAENRWVLSLVWNVGRHCEDVTSGGRLFQVLAAATGNAWSPIVESHVSGTASAEPRSMVNAGVVDQEVQRQAV